jgi:hypothetical protein
MNPIKQNSASGAIPVRCLFLWGPLKSPAKMEFNSRLDEKRRLFDYEALFCFI